MLRLDGKYQLAVSAENGSLGSFGSGSMNAARRRSRLAPRGFEIPSHGPGIPKATILLYTPPGVR